MKWQEYRKKYVISVLNIDHRIYQQTKRRQKRVACHNTKQTTTSC